MLGIVGNEKQVQTLMFGKPQRAVKYGRIMTVHMILTGIYPFSRFLQHVVVPQKINK